jgi:hypothetical protein
VYLIDHGAGFYRQHATEDYAAEFERPFPQIKDHVLWSRAGDLREASARNTEPALAALQDVVGAVPEEWLVGPARKDYAAWLERRIKWGGFLA